MPAPIITLTTDFGEGSPYVAEMKGVILSIQPEARLVDISHSIPSQDIRRGALVLEQATPKFPPASIHVAVVDPGVGTPRKIVHACLDGRRYLAPDNGLLGLLALRHEATELISLTESRYWRTWVSRTFHGRDIMAPVAAHLALGVTPAELGEPLEQLTPLDWPPAVLERGEIAGEIASIDSFGNLITNIESELLGEIGGPNSLRIVCGSGEIRGLAITYGAAQRGELIALIGSGGRLEIAIVQGSAAKELSVGIGGSVRVEGR